MQIRTAFGLAAAAIVAATAVACGGGSSPTAPSGGGNPSTGGVGATITITPSGVNPSSVSIAAGQSIAFVNNDTQAHVMSSDPHPSHTDCPALTVGSLGAGQTRTSNPLTSARTCGFHDHDAPGDSRWQGQVRVQ
ncbi:MAG TPA: hypothetical protein VK886_18655 [Vicinamibacterales bacterium]|nr:hypothetical protein [Vicinamibacterales bacterium]